MTTKTKHEPLVIISLVTGAVGIVLQLGLWVFWGGRLSQSVVELDKRETIAETAITSNNNSIAEQKLNIAVLGTKLDGIKSGVDTLNGKVDAGNRK